jgi:hypothetical protein
MKYYLAIKKNQIMSFCRKMDGSEGHHIKWNKPDSERQVSHVFSQMWNLNLKKKQHESRAIKEEERGEGELRITEDNEDKYDQSKLDTCMKTSQWNNILYN